MIYDCNRCGKREHDVFTFSLPPFHGSGEKMIELEEYRIYEENGELLVHRKKDGKRWALCGVKVKGPEAFDWMCRYFDTVEKLKRIPKDPCDEEFMEDIGT